MRDILGAEGEQSFIALFNEVGLFLISVINLTKYVHDDVLYTLLIRYGFLLYVGW